MLRRLFWPIIILGFLSGPTWAVDDVIAKEQETWRRIETIAMQRQLAQRIEQATCYVMTGVETAHFSSVAAEAADIFDRNLMALVAGSADLGLSPETDPNAIEALKTVMRLWEQFAPAARQVMSGDLHSIPVRQLINLDLPLLQVTEFAAQSIKTVHQDRLVARKAVASTLDIAARQRMLAVRLAKSFCYVALDLNRDAMIADMQTAIAEFETALVAMEFGDYDMEVIDPPNLAVMSALMDVRTAWTAFQAHLELALEEPATAAANLSDVAAQSDVLSDLSGKVVALYKK